MIVDFMIIGAQKSGTSSLAGQLAAHSQICFSKKKEPGYFNQEVDWRPNLPEYEKQFRPLPGQILGEASTMYTFFPEHVGTHVRLMEYNPNLKLIYIMRHPVKRIISHYSHNVVRSLETDPPELAVVNDPRYVYRSRYAVQIRPYLELFGPDAIMLLTFEEYVADQIGVLQQVARFLGVNADEFQHADTEAKHQTIGEYYLKSPRVEMVVGSDYFQPLRRIVPDSIRKPIRHRFFSNRLPERPEFSEELQSNLWRLVEDDVVAIEALLNRQVWSR